MTTSHPDALHDPRRLAALRRTALLNSPAEEAFDRLTRLAARVLHVPVVLVSLVDEDGQFFKSCIGLPEPWASRRWTPLSLSFCQHAVASGEPLVIADAREHPLVRDNLAIPQLGVIGYAGIPLITSDGYALGSFCAIDSQPRVWTDDDIALLRDLAAAVMTEIELRTASSEAERERQEKLALLDSAGEGMYGVDLDGRITFLNHVAADLLGYRVDDAMGKNSHELIHHTRADGSPYPATDCPVYLAFERGTRVRVDDDVLWRSDGRMLPVEYSSAPIVRDGVIEGAVVTFSVTTARRQADEEREQLLAREREARREAEEALRLRDWFVSSMSHDLKTPLTTIKGLAQMLRRRAARANLAGDAWLLDGLASIDGATSRMAGMVADLLDVARVRMGRPLDLQRGPTKLVRLVQQAAAAQGQALERHTIRVEAGTGEIVGMWDHSRLERVMSNLLSNAVKYSPDGGEIVVRITADPGGDEAELTVRDPGIGIPEADLPHIFDRFYRAGNAAEHIQGSGIGLATVRHIVEQHGGAITVASREGDGTTFTVRLPVRQPADEPAREGAM